MNENSKSRTENRKRLTHYRAGDEAPNGGKIKMILENTPKVLTYIGDDDHFYYSIKNDFNHSAITKKYRTLNAEVPSDIPDDLRINIRKDLCTALASAINTEEEDRLAEFNDIENKIKQLKTSTQLRILYTTWSIVYAAIAIMVLVILQNKEQTLAAILMAVIGGIGGACLSTITQHATLNLDNFTEIKYLHMQIYIKLVTGGISGYILYVGIQNDILLSLFKDKAGAIMLFSIMAGFSERFIPNLLKSLETKADISTSEKTKGS